MRAVRLTGDALDAFLARIDYVRTHRDDHSGLSVAVDGEGVKLQLDGTWSPAVGEPVADGIVHVELTGREAAAVEYVLFCDLRDHPPLPGRPVPAATARAAIARARGSDTPWPRATRCACHDTPADEPADEPLTEDPTA